MLAGGRRQCVSRGDLEEEMIQIPFLKEERLIAELLSDFN
jgi:hypothetical protein